MFNFVPAGADGGIYDYAWIGAMSETYDCTFKFIDGRPLPTSSVYWFYNHPTHCHDLPFHVVFYLFIVHCIILI